jgi:hypothetical protein
MSLDARILSLPLTLLNFTLWQKYFSIPSFVFGTSALIYKLLPIPDRGIIMNSSSCSPTAARNCVSALAALNHVLFPVMNLTFMKPVLASKFFIMSASLASLVTVALVIPLFPPFLGAIASTCMGLPQFSPEFVPACTPTSLPLLLDPTVRHSVLFPPLLDIISFNCLLGRVSTYILGTIVTRCYGFECPKNYVYVALVVQGQLKQPKLP